MTSTPKTSTVKRLNLYSMKVGGLRANRDGAGVLGFLQALARLWDDKAGGVGTEEVLTDVRALEMALEGLAEDAKLPSSESVYLGR